MGKVFDTFVEGELLRHRRDMERYLSEGDVVADYTSEYAAKAWHEATTPLSFGQLVNLIFYLDDPVGMAQWDIGHAAMSALVRHVAPGHPHIEEAAGLIGGIFSHHLTEPAFNQILSVVAKAAGEDKAIILKDMITSPELQRLKRSAEWEAAERERRKKIAIDLAAADSFEEAEEKGAHFTIINRFSKNLYTAMISMQLMNPRIVASKILTDALNIPVQVAFKSAAAGIEYGPRAGVKTLLGGLYGLRAAFKDALHYGVESFRTNTPAFQIAEDIAGEEGHQIAYGLDHLTASDTPITTTSRWLYASRWVSHQAKQGLESYPVSFGRRGMLGGDQFAKAMAWRAELYMNAYIKAYEEAQGMGFVAKSAMHQFAEEYAQFLVSHPTNDLLEMTKEAMFRDTFTNNSRLSRWVAELGYDNLAVRLADPYTRTPINLVTGGISMSPLAPIITPHHFWGDVINGDKIAQHMALLKFIAGTLMWAHIIHEQAKGNYTGHGPYGFMREIWPMKDVPTSIRFGNYFYSYNHMGPYATTFGMAADFGEAYHWTNDPSLKGKIQAGAIHMLGHAMDDVEFLELMQNFVHARDQYERYGKTKGAEEMAARVLDSFVPAPARIYAQTVHPAEREANGLGQMLMENIPGWRGDVPIRRDWQGRPVYPPSAMSDGELLNPVYRLLNSESPIERHKRPSVSPTELEMFRLKVDLKSVPDHAYTAGGNPIPMKPEYQDEWKQMAGQTPYGGYTQKEAMAMIIDSPGYSDMPDYLQRHDLQMTHDTYFAASKADLSLKHPDIMDDLMNATDAAMNAPHAPQPITPGGEKVPPIIIDLPQSQVSKVPQDRPLAPIVPRNTPGVNQ